MDTFCACGRRVEDYGGSRAGCSGWYDTLGTAPMDVQGVTPTVPRSSSATVQGHPVAVWVGTPTGQTTPVDQDQRQFDRRARLQRERNASDRQALARRGGGK